MVPSQANQGQFALIAASTDLRLLPRRDSHSTRHVALRTTLIPSSPANRIVARINAGNLLRKVNHEEMAARILIYLTARRSSTMNKPGVASSKPSIRSKMPP